MVAPLISDESLLAAAMLSRVIIERGRWGKTIIDRECDDTV